MSKMKESEAMSKYLLMRKESQEAIRIEAQTRAKLIEMGFTNDILCKIEEILDKTAEEDKIL
jgi:hypothetical protein